MQFIKIRLVKNSAVSTPPHLAPRCPREAQQAPGRTWQKRSEHARPGRRRPPGLDVLFRSRAIVQDAQLIVGPWPPAWQPCRETAVHKSIALQTCRSGGRGHLRSSSQPAGPRAHHTSRPRRGARVWVARDPMHLAQLLLRNASAPLRMRHTHTRQGVAAPAR